MGLLVSTFRQSLNAATPENPRFSLNDPAAWEAFVGPRKSASGLPVNADIALTYGPWYRGVNLISNDVAKLPLFVYRRTGDVGKEKDKGHPAFRLLRRQPNERQTAYQFKKLMIARAMTRGNAYAAIERLGSGAPAGLLPLSVDDTFPVLESRDGEPGRLWYVTTVGKTQRKLLPENVLHIHGLGTDGIMGIDVIEKARDSLGLGLGAERYTNITLRNNGRPSIVLQVPNKMRIDAMDNLRKQWETMYAGIDNAARTAVLDNGMEAKEISFSPRDAQLKDIRDFQVRDVACFLNLPPHKLGDSSRNSYNSLEQENQSYLDESLDPWLVATEDECWEKLLTEEEKDSDSHVIEFLRGALVRANLADRANYYRTALGGRPWVVPDEVRDMENMAPLGGEAGEYLNPLNMGKGGPDNQEQPAGAPTKPKQDPEIEPADAQAPELRVARLAIADAATRVARRLAAQAEKAAGAGGAAFCGWLDSMVADNAPIVRDYCKVAEAAAAAGDGHIADYLLASLALHWKAAETQTAANLLPAVRSMAGPIAARVEADTLEVFL
jgi:HK97 family phage portal protein